MHTARQVMGTDKVIMVWILDRCDGAGFLYDNMYCWLIADISARVPRDLATAIIIPHRTESLLSRFISPASPALCREHAAAITLIYLRSVFTRFTKMLTKATF